jgi:hypothetical protein
MLAGALETDAKPDRGRRMQRLIERPGDATTMPADSFIIPR